MLVSVIAARCSNSGESETPTSRTPAASATSGKLAAHQTISASDSPSSARVMNSKSLLDQFTTSARIRVASSFNALVRRAVPLLLAKSGLIAMHASFAISVLALAQRLMVPGNYAVEATVYNAANAGWYRLTISDETAESSGS